jgi:hypothetical protein
MAIVNMILMTRRRKPGVPYMRHFLDSPYNIMFRPGDLTEGGLLARNRIFWGVIGFFICFALVAGMGLSGVLV